MVSMRIVAISGHDQQENHKEFKGAGINLHITKPVDLESIAESFLNCGTDEK
jgi:CheY-like chemotaxis protein